MRLLLSPSQVSETQKFTWRVHKKLKTLRDTKQMLLERLAEHVINNPNHHFPSTTYVEGIIFYKEKIVQIEGSIQYWEKLV